MTKSAEQTWMSFVTYYPHQAPAVAAEIGYPEVSLPYEAERALAGRFSRPGAEAPASATDEPPVANR
jgi:hypothetical protein